MRRMILAMQRDNDDHCKEKNLGDSGRLLLDAWLWEYTTEVHLADDGHET